MSHHPCFIPGIEIYIGADFIILPGHVPEDGVVMPFRRPTEGMLADGLPDARTLMVGPFREFEAADEVGQVMRQVSILRRAGILLKSVLVREGKRF